MTETSREWVNSKKKRAEKIMWDTQGQDFDHVITLIMEDCGINNLRARALYRNLAREKLIAEGFVPAPDKRGRPRKDGKAPIPRKASKPVSRTLVDRVSDEVWNHDATKDNVNCTDPDFEKEEEEVVERTETGERKSIADMKAYLEQLKRKAG